MMIVPWHLKICQNIKMSLTLGYTFIGKWKNSKTKIYIAHSNITLEILRVKIHYFHMKAHRVVWAFLAFFLSCNLQYLLNIFLLSRRIFILLSKSESALTILTFVHSMSWGISLKVHLMQNFLWAPLSLWYLYPYNQKHFSHWLTFAKILWLHIESLWPQQYQHSYCREFLL